MTIIVKKTTQLIAGLVFLYGIYIIIHGHLTPGGGFAGGVVLAGSLILQIPGIRERFSETCERRVRVYII